MSIFIFLPDYVNPWIFKLLAQAFGGPSLSAKGIASSSRE